MITYSTRNEIVFMAIYKVNLKFTHELMKETNENNFAYFLRDLPDLIAKKWREYGGLN